MVVTVSARPSLLLAAGVSLVLLLAGCTAGTPAGGGTPSSTPSASETASPSPTPTPTVEFDALDSSTWMITTSSIGPARLGDIPDEQVAVIFEPAFVKSNMCEGLTGYDPADPASAVSAFTGVSGFESPEHPGWLRTVGVTAFEAPLSGPVAGSPKTAEGIGLGSSRSELTTAYPAIQPWTDPRGAGELPQFTLTDAEGSLIFTIREDRVVSIVAAFDLPPAGYCS